MFNNKESIMEIDLNDWQLDGMKNPFQLQAYILNKFEDSTNGKYTIVDPNNVATFLIEAFSTMASSLLKKVDDTVLPAIYPNRAISSSDLYKHLSDFDYVGLFSYPAQTEITVILDMAYLINNGVLVDQGSSLSNRQLIIPSTTKFKIGNYTFGLYYPVRIKVSPITKMFSAEYVTDGVNPLKQLSTNVLEYTMHKSEGLLYAFVKIPVYQFEISSTTEPMVNGSGYRKVITYSDKFYAIRCFAEVRDTVTGEWSKKELALAMSGMTYDPDNPTVVFSVDPEYNQCVVEIPYVYFTNNRLRGNLQIDIYTTSGSLDFTIPTDTSDMVEIDMFGTTIDSEIAPYAEPFRTMPGFEATPVSTKIIGGSNGYTYEELRKRVITDSFGINVLQTPKDIDTYFANEGYVTSLYKDGITDRVYNAHATLRWTDGSIVSCASLDTLITLEDLKNTNSIINPLEDTYTILPSTRYKFDSSKGLCVPLSNDEISTLNDMTAMARVSEFNSNAYTLCPFHVQVSVKNKYPTTAVFDLTDADIDSNVFLTSRSEISQNLSVNSALMSVVPVNYVGESDMVTDKYKISINVVRTGLDDITAYMQGSEVQTVKQFMCLVGIKKVDGSFSFAEAEWVGRSSNIDTFEILISATAAFAQVNEDHTIIIKSPFDADNGINVFMTSEMRIVLCIRRTLADSVVVPKMYLDSDFTMSGIEGIENFVAVSENRLTAHFGKLVNELDARMSLAYSEETYSTYDTTEFLTEDYDVYETNEHGVPTYTEYTEDNVRKIRLNVKYPAGTLTSFTKSFTESMLYSKLFVNNLIGCSASYLNGTEPIDVKFKKNEYPSNAPSEGTVITVSDAHVVPQFSVSAATLDSQGVNECIGKYTIRDVITIDSNANIVPSVGAYSSQDNKWYKVSVDSGGSAVYYCLEAMDALEFLATKVLGNQATKDDKSYYTNVVDGIDEVYYTADGGTTTYPVPISHYKTDPLSEVEASDGMVILVVHDGSYNENKYVEDIRSNICDLREETSEGLPSVIYFRLNGKWIPLLVFESSNAPVQHGDSDTISISDMFIGNTLSKLISDVIGSKESNRGYKKDGKNCGFVYFMHRVSYNGSAVSDYPHGDNQTIYQYISFLTKNNDGVPCLKSLYVNQDDRSEENLNWSHVNKWPWEVSEWRRFKLATDSRITYTVDTLFETEFDSTRMGAYCRYQSGQIILGSNGKPKSVATPRKLNYIVNMLHVDAKLAETYIAKATGSYPKELIKTMRTHFNNLGTIKNRLYSNTKLFFEPMRTIGYGKFYTDGDTISEYPLDIRMGFRLHVSSDVANDPDMMAYMRTSVIGIIDDHMANGGCSMTTIAEMIKEENSDSVRYVDVLGIDGDPDLQTMRCVDPEIRPHLKHELQLEDDGTTITLTRGLDIEFVAADE